MTQNRTFGEYVRHLRRRKRWSLQDLATNSGLSLSHLSRIENDNAIPNPETVVRLATAIEGELETMLELADCLPREILERLIRRVQDATASRKRTGGNFEDPSFPEALVRDLDPLLLRGLTLLFGLSLQDASGLYDALKRMALMPQEERLAVISFLASNSRGQKL